MQSGEEKLIGLRQELISWSEGLLIGTTIVRRDQFDRGFLYFPRDQRFLRIYDRRNSFPNSSHKRWTARVGVPSSPLLS